MRALHVLAPNRAEVVNLPEPAPRVGELLVEIDRAGICGTDVELFTGDMAYFGIGRTTFPLQLGHEWTGTVIGVGDGAQTSWLGKRITGDTMMGCGDCDRCNNAKSHLCADRIELGITDGWGGALAERIVFPVRYAYEVPATVSVETAAMIEPAGNALRSVEACALKAGGSVLILGAGTIGLLAAQFALAKQLDVHIASHREKSLELARSIGVKNTYLLEEISAGPNQIFDAVIDASNIETMPSLAINKVAPGGRVSLIGLSPSPSLIDTREFVLQDVTILGILSASPGLAGAIQYFASGMVNPEPLISEVIGLADVPSRLTGNRGTDAGPGPKILVNPRL